MQKYDDFLLIYHQRNTHLYDESFLRRRQSLHQKNFHDLFDGIVGSISDADADADADVDARLIDDSFDDSRRFRDLCSLHAHLNDMMILCIVSMQYDAEYKRYCKGTFHLVAPD